MKPLTIAFALLSIMCGASLTLSWIAYKRSPEFVLTPHHEPHGVPTGKLINGYQLDYDQFADDPENPSFILLNCTHSSGVLLVCDKMAAKI